MRYALSLAVVLAVPVPAVAEDAGRAPALVPVGPRDQAVIGGNVAQAGKWPDAAAVQWGNEQGCSGTLIAPTVVVTAGHCIDGGGPNYVVLDAIDESGTQGGERIRIVNAYEYPSSFRTIDAAVLLLERPALAKPRAIASGWARFDIKNGATIALVGYGTTDRNGNIDSPKLMEATSVITDYNCTTSAGCNPQGRPDGELGAGGMGIDTCPGDSGGPLYLVTPYGDFLAGITSRGYDDNYYYCSEGGIYGRADKIVDWIEETTGLAVTRGPEPTAELLTVVRGRAGETQIAVNDPKEGASHTFAIVTPPTYGRAAVSESGIVRVCPNDDVVGGDSVTVSVTDAADPARTLQVTVPLLVEDGDPADSCDETAFGEDGGGGCCDTRRSASGSLPLVLFVALVLRRRRQTR